MSGGGVFTDILAAAGRIFEVMVECSSDDLFIANCETVRGLGLWAARLMALPEEDAVAYAQALEVAFIRPGPFDIVARLQADFRAKGLEVSEHRIAAEAERERETSVRKARLRVFKQKAGTGGWERRRSRRMEIRPPVLPPALKAWAERHR